MDDTLSEIRLECVSSGERAKLEIAAIESFSMMAQDLGFMILDEPFSALDQTALNIALEELKKISKDKQVIYISHDVRFKDIASENVTVIRKNGEINVE